MLTAADIKEVNNEPNFIDELNQTAFGTLTPETLTAERGTTHGAFSDHARYTQQLKSVAYRAYNERTKRGQPALTNQQKESLEMILHKVGRILAGDASFADHWDDIGGYAHIANKEF